MDNTRILLSLEAGTDNKLMRIHKEGYKILFYLFIALSGFILFIFYSFPEKKNIQINSIILSGVIYLLILQFFRNPKRTTIDNPSHIFAPADGKVVAVEEVYEGEYFQENRRQVSIFMSPFNVHINWSPVSGIVQYFQYHAGKTYVAWHPKSSSLNERTTIVIETPDQVEILIRQIAGALAKRIVWYLKAGEKINQGEQLGFIKFGSRVDLFLPLDANVKVDLGDKTKGGETIIAELAGESASSPVLRENHSVLK